MYPTLQIKKKYFVNKTSLKLLFIKFAKFYGDSVKNEVGDKKIQEGQTPPGPPPSLFKVK